MLRLHLAIDGGCRTQLSVNSLEDTENPVTSMATFSLTRDLGNVSESVVMVM